MEQSQGMPVCSVFYLIWYALLFWERTYTCHLCAPLNRCDVRLIEQIIFQMHFLHNTTEKHLHETPAVSTIFFFFKTGLQTEASCLLLIWMKTLLDTWLLNDSLMVKIFLLKLQISCQPLSRSLPFFCWLLASIISVFCSKVLADIIFFKKTVSVSRYIR